VKGMAEDNDEAWLNEVDTLVLLSPEFEKAVFVRYRDHVMYNRATAALMQPQTREAIGWLIHEAKTYIIISWDRDAGPPTLHGGDPKASGLVLLKSDIISYKKLCPDNRRICELNLKSKPNKQDIEYAFRPSERKTQRAKSSKGEN
jgi:hypothetical protein